MQGFSLVELVVTVAVVGILAGLAVKNYEEYRAKVNDLIAFNQLLMARQSTEVVLTELDNLKLPMTFNYNSDESTYFSVNLVEQAQGLPGYVHVKDVSLHVCARDSSGNGYTISSVHSNGTFEMEQIGGRAARRASLKHFYFSNLGETRSLVTISTISCPSPITPNP